MPTPPLLQHVNENFDDYQYLAKIFGPRILAALIGGGLIGAENQIYGKPAGLRTCLLVAISTCIITIVSIETAYLFGGEPSRITAQIVSGIGFLGGGVILRHEGKVSGITTAATIFVTAGIGVTAGSGFILTGVSIGILSFLILLVLRPLDRFIDTFPKFVRMREFDRAHKRERVRSRKRAARSHIVEQTKPEETK